MDAKSAVRVAKTHVSDLFADDDPTNIGLEELERGDDGVWNVTIGFTRAWDTEPKNALSVLVQTIPRRTYKVVRIEDESGQVLSVKNREGT